MTENISSNLVKMAERAKASRAPTPALIKLHAKYQDWLSANNLPPMLAHDLLDELYALDNSTRRAAQIVWLENFIAEWWGIMAP